MTAPARDNFGRELPGPITTAIPLDPAVAAFPDQQTAAFNAGVRVGLIYSGLPCEGCGACRWAEGDPGWIECGVCGSEVEIAAIVDELYNRAYP